MDPRLDPREDWNPAIDAILHRARRLTPDEIIALARGESGLGSDRTDRGRILGIAAARAGRPLDLHRLRVAVGASISPELPPRTRHALVRLGYLDRAERVVTQAAMVILLRDRLGARSAVKIARPWSTLR
jgi:hypothetical protein